MEGMDQVRIRLTVMQVVRSCKDSTILFDQCSLCLVSSESRSELLTQSLRMTLFNCNRSLSFNESFTEKLYLVYPNFFQRLISIDSVSLMLLHVSGSIPNCLVFYACGCIS